MRYLFIAAMAMQMMQAQNIELLSPDKNISISVSVKESGLTYSTAYKGKTVLAESPLGMDLAQSAPLGKNLSLTSIKRQSMDETWKPVTAKHSQIRNYYNEMTLSLKEKIAPAQTFFMIFRAYNDGIAFRYVFTDSMRQRDIFLRYENSAFNFPGDPTGFVANLRNYKNDYEEEYWPTKISDITQDVHVAMPLLVKLQDSLWCAVTESDLIGWAGSVLKYPKKTAQGYQLHIATAPIPGEDEASVKVYAKTPCHTPWRIVMIANHPGRFIESELVMNLAPVSKLKDVSWIKPGMCAWDNWWCCGLKMDTETNKKFIQFAADMGYPYQLIDWTWYGDFSKPTSDILKINSKLDLPEVLRFAKGKGVKCWLWLHYDDAIRQYEQAFPIYEKWGVVGVKVDFWRREDREMISNYEKMAAKAAECHLMINFHSANKNTGLERTYPNVMTREGVMGDEFNGWSTRVTPEYNTTIPFTRMLAGPMDYTPGGFLNGGIDKFRAGSPTMVMNTRAAELAKFVIYFSPIVTVADHPDHYKDQPGLEFLKMIPADMDEMIVLQGYPGEYIVTARRKGNNWYVGAMTNSQPREIEIDLGFLGNNKYKSTFYADAPDADVNPERLSILDTQIYGGKNKLKIKMVKAGGWAAVLKAEK
jgi:alpha-glucosidase